MAILKLILVVIALVGAVAAIAWLYRDTVLVRLFGPPVVTLTEAYQENPTGLRFDHSALDAVVARPVDEHGWGVYDGLPAVVVQLERSIGSLDQAPFDEWGRSE